MPSVSVIIPTFNHARFVCEAIDSVLAQSFTDYEIIVVNDDSPDNTVEVLAHYTKNRIIEYYFQQNAGVAAARNTGVRFAQGTYIAFLDDDDLWPRDKLLWQVSCLRETKACAVGGTTAVLRNESTEIPIDSHTRDTLKPLDFFGGCPFHSPGQVLIDRQALLSVGGFDESIWGSDDLDLYIRLAASGQFVAYGKCALIYRVHEANASRASERMFWNCRKVLEKNIGLVPFSCRFRARQFGYRWLYDYVGKRVLEERMARKVSKKIDILFAMIPGMLRSRALTKLILRDLQRAFS